MYKRQVWEKVAKGRAGLGRDDVDDKVWNEIGGNQDDVVLSMEKYGGTVQDTIKQMIEVRQRLALKNRLEGEERLAIYGRSREDTAQWTTRKR